MIGYRVRKAALKAIEEMMCMKLKDIDGSKVHLKVDFSGSTAGIDVCVFHQKASFSMLYSKTVYLDTDTHRRREDILKGIETLMAEVKAYM